MPAVLFESLGVFVLFTWCLGLAGTIWKDASLRNSKKIEWQSWAQRKYHKLAR